MSRKYVCKALFDGILVEELISLLHIKGERLDACLYRFVIFSILGDVALVDLFADIQSALFQIFVGILYRCKAWRLSPLLFLLLVFFVHHLV